MKKMIVNLRQVFEFTRSEGLLWSRQVVKWAGNIIHPLKDLPVPDFNNQYDSTML